MALLPHKSGCWRAYRKINGKEYQFYSKDYKIAKTKQEYFDSIAQLHTRNIFNTSGRLSGVGIAKNRNKLYLKMEITRSNTKFRKTFSLESRSLRQAFKEMIPYLKEARGLISMHEYASQVKMALSLYQSDIDAYHKSLSVPV